VEIWGLNRSDAQNTGQLRTMVALLHRSHPQQREQRRCAVDQPRNNSQLPLPQKMEQKNMQLHQTVHRKRPHHRNTQWWPSLLKYKPMQSDILIDRNHLVVKEWILWSSSFTIYRLTANTWFWRCRLVEYED